MANETRIVFEPAADCTWHGRYLASKGINNWEPKDWQLRWFFVGQNPKLSFHDAKILVEELDKAMRIEEAKVYRDIINLLEEGISPMYADSTKKKEGSSTEELPF